MNKLDEAEINSSGDETHDISTTRRLYDSLGFVGLCDDSEGEALLQRLNIASSIVCVGHDSFSIAPEWVSRFQDWQKNAVACLTPADKARVERSFDEVEFLFDSYWVLAKVRLGSFTH